MDIRQLRYFLEIVEHGSLTRASEHLGVAQPALSLHLKNMEQELGTRLLDRSRSWRGANRSRTAAGAPGKSDPE